jgi:hypothetical protein
MQLRFLSVAVCWLFVLSLAAPLRATEPVIRDLNVRGLQINGTTPLVLDGDALGTAPRLLLSFPVQQQLRKGSTDKRATFDVTLPADVTPGYYHLRVVTAQGVSLPVVIGVDRLAQRPLTAAVEALPIALHGVVNGAATTETRFVGKAGQKVLVEVEAQRLGSKLRPVVHLSGPKHLQIAWAWPTPALSGDARLEATLSDDGPYTVTLHDAEYAAAAPAFFRLRIGQWSYVDQVFPPVVAPGPPRAVELLGPSAVRLDGVHPQAAGVLPLAWPSEGLWSGPRPFMRVSAHPEVIRQAPADQVQELSAGPVGVSGRLLKPYEEDRYRIPVTPGSKLRLEVFAERYGSPLDAALVVRDDKGAQLARAEDGPDTLDPVLEYTVPAKTTAVIVGVVDAQGRGGPHGVYHLNVDPQQATGTGDYRLLTPIQRLSLPEGGRLVVPVWIERRGYEGSVEVAATDLPAGVRLEGTTIPAQADGTLVTVERGTASGDAVITRWHGRGAGGAERPVVINGHPLERLQPWLATELALAPTTAKAADFVVDWKALPASAALVPAMKLELPVQLTRPADASVVRLTLVTSQLTPVLNNQPNPNLALRQEKAVELAAKAKEGSVTVLVPPQLTGLVYDVTVQAELLAADKKTVRAVAYAPVRRLTVQSPLLVRLDGPSRIEAALDPKKAITVKIQGKIERREGVTGDVLLNLTGLPAGAKAAAVTVKTGATAFTLNVVLPPGLPAGELKGLKLAGTLAPNPRQPNVRVRSRDVELTVVVKATK